MNFEDVCWLDSLFEKMMHDARKGRGKHEVLAVIRNNHALIKEQKIEMADGILRCP